MAMRVLARHASVRYSAFFIVFNLLMLRFMRNLISFFVRF